MRMNVSYCFQFRPLKKSLILGLQQILSPQIQLQIQLHSTLWKALQNPVRTIVVETIARLLRTL